MTKAKAILLDFYGTVVHEDDAVIEKVTAQIAKSIGRTDTTSEIGQHWWRTFVTLCDESHGAAFRPQRILEHEALLRTLRHFGSPLDAGRLGDLLYTFWQRPPVFDDATKFLRRNELPVCVVSNIDKADITCAIEYHALNFQHVVTSEDALAYKPRGEMFVLALAALDVSPAEVVHVGDSLSNDVQAALAMGMRSVWVNRTAKPVSALPT